MSRINEGFRSSPAARGARFVVRVVTALIPPVLVLTNVRALLTHTFLEIEYRMPGFPPDPYGFTREDRLQWASIALDYLLNDAGVEFLGDLRFADGAPVYNARELRHMEDVKRLTQTALWLWRVGLAAAAGGLALLTWRARHGQAWKALSTGGQLTLGLMAVLGLALLLSFSFVFVGFHRLFFEGDTWLFRYSDTLIRLFPERFWRDALLWIAGLTAAEAALLWGAARRALGRDASGARSDLGAG